MNINKFIVLIIWVMSIHYTYLSAQVNHSTGQAIITTPIYTLNDGNLSIPLFLNYDASGIKADAIASNVGLNWDLTAGGKIVRIVRDKPDESLWEAADKAFKGYFHEGYPITGTDYSWAFGKDLEPDLFVLSLHGESFPFLIKKNANQDPKIELVFQNDDISIELITTNGSPSSTIPSNFQEPIDSTLNRNNHVSKLLAFKVTTTDGLVHYFGEKVQHREYGLTYNTYAGANCLFAVPNDQGSGGNAIVLSAPSVWNISRIILPKGVGTDKFQEVTFDYERKQFVAFNTLHFEKEWIEHSADCTPIATQSFSSFLDQPIYLQSELKKIESNNFRIEFNSSLLNSSTPSNITGIIKDYETGTFNDKFRSDISTVSNNSVPNPVPTNSNVRLIDHNNSVPTPLLAIPKAEALRNIVVIDKVSAAKIGFYLHTGYYNDYSYISSTGEKQEYPNRYLKLLGVYEISFESNATTLLQGYRFGYDGKTLPDRFSAARDRWGLFNGQDQNIQQTGLLLIPPYRNPVTFADATNCTTSNLNTGIGTVATGTLTNIQLPTGGTVEYEYEAHDCDNFHTENIAGTNGPQRIGHRPVGGLRVKSITAYEPTNQITHITKYSYKKKDNVNESSGFLSFWPEHLMIRKVGSDWKQYLAPGYAEMISSRFINGNYLTYRCVKEEDIFYQGNQPVNNGYTLYEFKVSEPEPFAVMNNGQWYTSDEVGKVYSFYMTAGVFPTFAFDKATPLAVRHYNRNNNLLSETEYTYEPVNLTNDINLKGALNLAPYEIKIDNKVIPQKYIDGFNQGINVVDKVGFYGSLVFPKLKYVSYAVYSARILSVIISEINGLFGLTDNSQYNIVSYQVPFGKVRLTKEVHRSYAETGDSPVETTTLYEYNSTKHNQVTKITNNYSTNGNLSTDTYSQTEGYIKYSTDYTIPSSPTDDEQKGIAALQSRKILAPVEQYTLKNGKVISGSYNQYFGDNTQPNQYGNLKKLWQLEAESPLLPSSANSATTHKASEISGSTIDKNPNYRAVIEYTDYNDRGLLVRSVSTDDNTLKAKMEYSSTFSGLIPTAATVAEGTSIARTQSFEHIPLFGTTKTTLPDNTFVTNQFDGFGRLALVKDHQTNVIQANDYLYANAPTVDNNITFELWTAGELSVQRVKIKDLSSTTTTTVTMTEIQAAINSTPNNPYKGKINVFANVNGQPKSVLFFMTGPVNKSNTVNENLLWGLFGEPDGFTPTLNNAPDYEITAKAYSRRDGGGELQSLKKINFRITN